MKKIVRVLIMVLLMIPVIINAKTYNYNEGKIRANNYINSFSDRSKYLFFNTNYGFSGGSITHADGYVTGGMLNKDEYILGDGTRQTYLSPGAEYWTMTFANASNLYTISNVLRSDRNINDNNTRIGVRVTEFVKPDSKVTGSGTQRDPWRFVESYKVIVGSNDTNMGTIEAPTSVLVNRGGVAQFKLSPKLGYAYKRCSCTVNYNDSTKMIKINNVTSDMNCLVTFDKAVYEISLEDSNPGVTKQAEPSPIFMELGNGWFYDRELESEMPIGSMITKPERTGYTFGGFKYSSEEIIDGTGKLLKIFTPTNLSQTQQKLTSVWTANKYTITLDKNNGTNTSTASIQATYDSVTLPSVTLPQRKYTVSFNMGDTGIEEPTALTSTYTFDGWTTTKDGNVYLLNNAATPVLQASVSGYTNATGKWIRTSNATVYAHWSSGNVTLPALNKTGYTCKWAAGSASGSQVAAGTSVTPTANITYYAVCSPKTVTVTFHANYSGNTSTNTQTFTYDVADQKFADTGLTKTGYNILGWTRTQGNTTRDYTRNYAVTNAFINTYAPTLDLYAIWQPNNYTITLNGNGATTAGTASIKAKYETTTLETLPITLPQRQHTVSFNMNGTGITQPSNITATKTLSGGWYTEASGGTEILTSGTNPTLKTNISGYTDASGNWIKVGAATLYAHWTGGSITLPALSKTGYNCKWAEGSASGTQYAAGASRTISANTTYYAVCTAKKIKVTFHANYSGNTSTNVQTYTYDVADQKFADTGLTKTGYNILGWTRTQGNTTRDYTRNYAVTNAFINTYAPTLDLYAIWQPNNYTITLNGNGATTAGTASIKAKYETTTLETLPITLPQRQHTVSFNMNGTGITQPSNITATKTLSGGWYTEASGGTEILTSGTNPTLKTNISGYTDASGNWIKVGAATLYAHWTGGSITLPALSKTGYNCKWAEGSASGTQYAAGASRTISANTTYYAVCTAKKIKVTFHANYSGNTSTNVQNFTYGVSGQSFANTGFTRSGYYIDGWTRTQGNTTRDYSTNSGVSDNWINSNSPSIDLYAVWKVNPTVTFTVNGALGEKVTYSGTASGSFTLDNTGKKSVTLKPGSYTFTSNVAKDTGDYSKSYSRTVNVSSGMTSFDFYPAGAIYWYGNGAVSGSSLYSKCGGISYSYSYGNGSTTSSDSGTANSITNIDTNRIQIEKNYIYVYVPSGGGQYYSQAKCKNNVSKGSFTKMRVYVEGGEKVGYYDSRKKWRFSNNYVSFAGSAEDNYSEGKHYYTHNISGSSVNVTIKFTTNILHNGNTLYAAWMY